MSDGRAPKFLTPSAPGQTLVKDASSPLGLAKSQENPPIPELNLNNSPNPSIYTDHHKARTAGRNPAPTKKELQEENDRLYSERRELEVENDRLSSHIDYLRSELRSLQLKCQQLKEMNRGLNESFQRTLTAYRQPPAYVPFRYQGTNHGSGPLV